MTDDGRAKRQSGVTLPTELWVYVEALKETGLFGDTTSSVIRTLVQQGVQEAVAKHIIKVRDFRP